MPLPEPFQSEANRLFAKYVDAVHAYLAWKMEIGQSPNNNNWILMTEIESRLGQDALLAKDGGADDWRRQLLAFLGVVWTKQGKAPDWDGIPHLKHAIMDYLRISPALWFPQGQKYRSIDDP